MHYAHGTSQSEGEQQDESLLVQGGSGFAGPGRARPGLASAVVGTLVAILLAGVIAGPRSSTFFSSPDLTAVIDASDGNCPMPFCSVDNDGAAKEYHYVLTNSDTIPKAWEIAEVLLFSDIACTIEVTPQMHISTLAAAENKPASRMVDGNCSSYWRNWPDEAWAPHHARIYVDGPKRVQCAKVYEPQDVEPFEMTAEFVIFETDGTKTLETDPDKGVGEGWTNKMGPFPTSKYSECKSLILFHYVLTNSETIPKAWEVAEVRLFSDKECTIEITDWMSVSTLAAAENKPASRMVDGNCSSYWRNWPDEAWAPHHARIYVDGPKRVQCAKVYEPQDVEPFEMTAEFVIFETDGTKTLETDPDKGVGEGWTNKMGPFPTSKYAACSTSQDDGDVPAASFNLIATDTVCRAGAWDKSPNSHGTVLVTLGKSTQQCSQECLSMGSGCYGFEFQTSRSRCEIHTKPICNAILQPPEWFAHLHNGDFKCYVRCTSSP
eukprot:TRINITY_DN9044_c0_g1_i2.p1 TRINITY_DN9044_c0_g1~~TRINITY_DN9044_c0_g1_i2.p1  ORF type:complete len:492 (+),score=58.28 TRINITY_DN9044_c0_g1_i2:83-1558(+)